MMYICSGYEKLVTQMTGELFRFRNLDLPFNIATILSAPFYRIASSSCNPPAVLSPEKRIICSIGFENISGCSSVFFLASFFSVFFSAFAVLLPERSGSLLLSTNDDTIAVTVSYCHRAGKILCIPDLPRDLFLTFTGIDGTAFSLPAINLWHRTNITAPASRR